MMTRENVLRECLSELEAQRAKNYQEEQRRREEFAARSPQAADLLEERRRALYAGMEKAFASPREAMRISEEMRVHMEEINRKLREELLHQGLPENYLQPVYRCDFCHDTGYVGEPIREQCSCLRKAVLNRLYQDEGLQGLSTQNFDTFDETVFPDDILPDRKMSQRKYMVRYRNRSEAFADQFRLREGKGILFWGETGVGKTFLMNCVCQRILSRGFSVLVVSAYRLVETMLQHQFNESHDELVQDMLNCDLLAIDDLGSEPLSRDGAASGLYYIVSERMNQEKAILITTNCSAAQAYKRYGDRIAARIYDTSRMMVFEIPGRDIREFLHRS